MITKEYKRSLYRTAGKIKIWLVDGSSIRRHVATRFYDIGAHKMFSFIPKNEIWVDDRLRAKERELAILKALRAYNLMEDGMKYENTNTSIEPIMVKCAKQPLLIPHRLNREIAKIKRREKRLW
jgi:hypothetical protein